MTPINPDPAKFRKGDEVLVRGTLMHDSPNAKGAWSVAFDDYYWTNIKLTDIVSYMPAPRPIEVGDRVRWNGQVGRVRGLNGDEAWIKTEGDFPTNIVPPIADLERIDES